jgi:hypothetical protein
MRANGNTKSLRNVPSKTTIRCVKKCQFHMPNSFPCRSPPSKERFTQGHRRWTWDMSRDRYS